MGTIFGLTVVMGEMGVNGVLTKAVSDYFDSVEKSADGCEMQHVSNEAEQVHFKFNNTFIALSPNTNHCSLSFHFNRLKSLNQIH